MLLTSARLGLHSRSRVVRLVCAASNGWVGYDTRELIRQLPNEELILKTLYSKFEVLDASTVAARELFCLTASGHTRNPRCHLGRSSGPLQRFNVGWMTEHSKSAG